MNSCQPEIGFFAEILFSIGTPERLARFCGTPYYLNGHIAMPATLSGIKNELRNKELATFMFDRQDQFKREMTKVHDALASKGCEFRSQVGSLTFGDKRHFIPLQVADTLAYEARKTLENGIVNPGAPDSPALQTLKENDRVFQISLCGKDCLEWNLEHTT
jgi:hypothetical protein